MPATLLKKKLRQRCFPWILQNTFFTELLRATVSDLFEVNDEEIGLTPMMVFWYVYSRLGKFTGVYRILTFIHDETFLEKYLTAKGHYLFSPKLHHRCLTNVLTLSWWRSLSYRSQSIDLLCKIWKIQGKIIMTK